MDGVVVPVKQAAIRTARRRSWLWAGALLLALAPFAPRAALQSYRSYEAAALASPLITKSATSGVAYLLGDSIAQSQSGKPADRGRLMRATIAGTFSHGPQLHWWTVLLERTGLPLLAKIALDQTIFSLYLNAAFCTVTELLQGRPLRATWAKVRAAAWPCLYAGWRFWPFAHAITYSVMPLHLRVLWVDVLEVAWVAILSATVARSKASSQPAPSQPSDECEGEATGELTADSTREAAPA